MNIEGLDFELICDLELKRDGTGTICEYDPGSKASYYGIHPRHAYGNGPFCKFRIPKRKDFGVYVIAKQGQMPLYLGRCSGITQKLDQRFNSGYGQISPRNPFEGGQQENCRINTLILQSAKHKDQLTLFFYQTPDGNTAVCLEARLLIALDRKGQKPPWNLAIPRSVC